MEMECGLVNGFGIGVEMLKSGDEFLVVAGGPQGVSGDEFVDELLDFSNDSEQDEELQQQLDEPGMKMEGKNAHSVLQHESTAPAQRNSVVSANDDFGSLPESELSVPGESLESLEWLSHFVEDSFVDYSFAGKLPLTPAEKRPDKEAVVSEQPCFTTPIQTKARTKRARTGVRIWPVLSPSFTESSTSSSFSSSSTSFSPHNPRAVQSHTSELSPIKPAAKKQKKKPTDGPVAGGAASQPRRCIHCGVTKTPQWRAGPMGSKTLCNACGVRYKSGRLLPEYRPACSPTFSTELHSNNHRKVLEMRRKKETETSSALVPQS